MMCCCLCPWSIALSDTVYKSVDKDGNVTYSTNPMEDAVSVESVDIEDPAATGDKGPGDAEDRIQQMHDIAEELQENRKQRELERQQAAEQARKEQEAAEQQRLREELLQQNQDRYPYYYPYPYPPYHPPHPPQKPRPPMRPIEPPPTRPLPTPR